jgi:chromosome segregation ATPase
MTYQRNPLAAPLLEARQAYALALEENQRLRERLAEDRTLMRELRADKTRLQARIADLKKYRPQAPHERADMRDPAEIRLAEATAEIAQYHRQRRANNQGYGRKKAS